MKTRNLAAKLTLFQVALLAISLAGTACARADQSTAKAIVNYVSYSDAFASAGQPSEDQIAQLHTEGLERVIYIAFTDQSQSLANEDRIVKQLGMEYLHVPVDWNKPLVADYEAVADALTRYPSKKTLLHCQMNFRASAFALLHRVINQSVPLKHAKADMDGVWRPNEVWRDFIFEVLKANDISPDCDGCDWTLPEGH